MTGAEQIAAERKRQIDERPWSRVYFNSGGQNQFHAKESDAELQRAHDKGEKG
jgi:hypothetical protein